MIVYHGLDDPGLLPRLAAVAVGNFDGLHLGHRKILGRLCREAAGRGLRSLVLTFDPHPERALGRKSVRMIDTVDQRLDRFAGTCVDAVVVTRFDASFAGLSCRDFVETVLKGRLGAREVVVGQNFRFGRGRRGDGPRLRALGREAGFGVAVVPPMVVGGRVVSSSAVRSLLGRGLVEDAARLLGRPYEIAGRVIPGQRRGRTLGFPTVNIRPDNEILPPGVFISEAVWEALARPSVTSIGTNPTFGPGPFAVETHLLSGPPSPEAPGVTVRLLRRIRPVRKFAGPSSLAARIGRDVEEARAYFAARPGGG